MGSAKDTQNTERFQTIPKSGVDATKKAEKAVTTHLCLAGAAAAAAAVAGVEHAPA